MSPVVPDAGGFVVISQVRPQNDQSNRPEGQSCNAPARMPKPIVTFYRGEPEVLGTTQIFSGILLISIGIVCTILSGMKRYYIDIVVISGVTIWSGILFIISGSLSVAASVKPTVGKVTSSLVMNIFSSLAAACGIIIVSIEISVSLAYPTGVLMHLYCAHYNNDMQCLGQFTPCTADTGILSFMLMLFTLMFCISISISVFGCKSVCRTAFQEVNVVIYQTTSFNTPDASREAPPDYTTAVMCDVKTQT
ncbi:hypothetical protein GDO78_015772 [Eleutherodactylus coqui]|uniref:Membrane-spanning 4-domains subfamily A member 4A-like n=2 Tax=Eleutherodactylus coqui TaxID=57060 RepID=A0A8J6EDC8_ELECQ|nr:hypothetical protein GDO78_015772 [Eleutherodactylus coqui]KAG9467012.1 hypothetical protein GDO78_015772 [Eleutherodactylus coqui]KAG9467013.1 hypothetical protein GDO78_015772 [Eleutherodactylus coqui]KAG9467014.1 hypothetical protein GDO78_015772 [Eleutherodactylus coqui]